MKPGTCKDCKYWRPKELSHAVCHPCDHGKVGQEAADGIFEEGMTYYHERIHTGPDFGCIHFEPK